jgi:hypothetical protein
LADFGVAIVSGASPISTSSSSGASAPMLPIGVLTPKGWYLALRPFGCGRAARRGAGPAIDAAAPPRLVILLMCMV